ncbi:MAG: hypothetical protein ACRDDM_08340, partial [Paraclostridium sp.]
MSFNEQIFYINNENKVIMYDENTVFIRSISSIYTLKGTNISKFVDLVMSKFSNGNSINNIV